MNHQTADYSSPCRHCGQHFNDHTERVFGCLGDILRQYEPTLDDAGRRHTMFTVFPVCPQCGVQYQYDDVDDLHDGSIVLVCGRWDGEGDSMPDAMGCGTRYRVEPYCVRQWSTEAVSVSGRQGKNGATP